MKIKNLFKPIIGEKYNGMLLEKEISRIQKISRFKTGETKLFSNKVVFTDSVSFLGSYNEIFKNEIYKFPQDDNRNIIIIDCGANIGLATIYFKLNHPEAFVLAYEPDPIIFKVLKNNIQSFNFQNVELFNEAIGVKQETLFFKMEGGHSGMLVTNPDDKTISVPITPLKEILAKYDLIDFLKIDIEGYEINIIPEIADKLKKVNRLFLEYHTFLDQPQRLSDIIRIIENAGFRYYIKEAAYKKNPYLEKELFYKMDMLINIFCYR